MLRSPHGIDLPILASNRNENIMTIKAGLPKGYTGVNPKLFKKDAIWRMDGLPDAVLRVQEGHIRFISPGPGREVVMTLFIENNTTIVQDDSKDVYFIDCPGKFEKPTKRFKIKEYIKSFLPDFSNNLLIDEDILSKEPVKTAEQRIKEMQGKELDVHSDL